MIELDNLDITTAIAILVLYFTIRAIRVWYYRDVLFVERILGLDSFFCERSTIEDKASKQ